jgi:hypothetical protein
MNCQTFIEKLIAEAHVGSMSIDRHFPFHGFDPDGKWTSLVVGCRIGASQARRTSSRSA